MGRANTIYTKLPYSGQEFSVPDNLYIIGTMNTADRSVEAIDTALRRRFSFVEMMPDYTLPELQNKVFDIPLPELLETINRRIEVLLDRDHQVGHSYFLNLTEGIALQQVFRDKIIPLLQEYFYGNFEKLGLVLGGGFIKLISGEKIKYARFEVEDLDIYQRSIYHLNVKALNDLDEFKEALHILMNYTTAKGEE